MHVQMNRFNNYARRVLALAHREAASLGHNTIGYEHIFLGLVQDEGNVGKLLEEQGLQIDAIRQTVDELAPSSKNFELKKVRLSWVKRQKEPWHGQLKSPEDTSMPLSLLSICC
jgi:ATP-dependent Clp protease ATP-binding subunit ClpA